MSDGVPVDGFPEYAVFSDGVVMNAIRGTVVAVSVNQSGLARVNLVDETGRYTQKSLALIVAEAFIPKPEHWAFNTPINVDGDRLNCSVDNLMWRPRWFALEYHKQFESPVFSPHPLVDLNTGEVYSDSRSVAVTFGLLERELMDAVHNRTYAFPTFQMFDYAD